MKRGLLRLLAIVLVLGHGVEVGSAVLCGRAHERHDACESSMPSGPSVGAATQAADPGPCNLLGPCGAPTTAVTSPFVLADFTSGDPAGTAPAVATMPASFTPAPIPPPPQA